MPGSAGPCSGAHMNEYMGEVNGSSSGRACAPAVSGEDAGPGTQLPGRSQPDSERP